MPAQWRDLDYYFIHVRISMKVEVQTEIHKCNLKPATHQGDLSLSTSSSTNRLDGWRLVRYFNWPFNKSPELQHVEFQAINRLMSCLLLNGLTNERMLRTCVWVWRGTVIFLWSIFPHLLIRLKVALIVGANPFILPSTVLRVIIECWWPIHQY